MLRRNIIIILMALELMLNAANLSLVAFSRFHVDPTGVPNYNAQVFVFFIISVAAAEVAVGFALVVAPFLLRRTNPRGDTIPPEILDSQRTDLFLGLFFALPLSLA